MVFSSYAQIKSESLFGTKTWNARKQSRASLDCSYHEGRPRQQLDYEGLTGGWKASQTGIVAEDPD